MATYRERLLAAIERSPLSKRQVARRFAELVDGEAETARRAIYKYLDPDPEKTQVPEPDRAVLLAEILDAPELADATPRRRDRLAELAAAMTEQSETLATTVRRLDDALERLEQLEAQLAQPEEAPTRRGSPP